MWYILFNKGRIRVDGEGRVHVSGPLKARAARFQRIAADLALRRVTIYLTGTRIHVRGRVSGFDRQRLRNVLAAEKSLV